MIFEPLNYAQNDFWATKWARNMGCEVKYVAPMLSQNNMSVDSRKIQSSFSKDWIQSNFAVALTKALYSDSVLDLEIVGCFLEVYERRAA
jgi:hypothetical protein